MKTVSQHIDKTFFYAGFSFCWINCSKWLSLEQNCSWVKDKLSSTTVDFIRHSCTITLISHPMGISKLPLLSLGYTFHTPAGSEHVQWTCHSPYKVLFFSYPSDLMKSTVVDEKLVFNSTTVLFQRKSTCYKTFFCCTLQIETCWVLVKKKIIGIKMTMNERLYIIWKCQWWVNVHFQKLLNVF